MYLGAVKGLLEALHADYKNAYLKSVKELLNAELFSDFMEMAIHLLEENYYIPAAVLIGGVLEENLRKLVVENNIDITRDDGSALKASAINDILKKVNLYNGLVHKQLTAWLSIRNSAAHGQYNEFIKEQVFLMHQGVLGFIANHPV